VLGSRSPIPIPQPAIWKMAEERNLPILGICYGFQEMAHALGGHVARAPHREFGHADVRNLVVADAGAAALFKGLPEGFQVWMSHGDKIHAVPAGFVKVGETDDCEFAAAASVGRPNRLFGLQFHPEVAHTPRGKDIISNFVVGICGAPQDWTMASFVTGASPPSMEEQAHSFLTLCPPPSGPPTFPFLAHRGC
jgi:GMP synthase (glutamine-hydrolysing)